MDTNTITTIITTVGFPIACCIYMFWHGEKQEERHREEIEKLRDTIDNNTKWVTKLVERLGGGDDD